MTLNGAWQLTLTDEKGEQLFLKAEVPGCVHTDLLREGILSDLYSGTRSETCQWVERCSALYRKGFMVPNPVKGSELVFDGLDTYAEITLNGKKLGTSEDMFVPARFSVDGALRRGMNVLEVCFRSPVLKTENLPVREGAFTTERLYTRRIQCTYGWDWVDRFVTMGIWRGVRLEVPKADALDTVYIATQSINAWSAQVAIDAAFASISGEGECLFTLKDPDGAVVWHKARAILPEVRGAKETVLREVIDVPSPRLWMPRGYGAPNLYTLIAETPAGSREVTFGIRTVSILQMEDAPGSPEAELARELRQTPQLLEWDRNVGSSGFILLVNGVRIFCRGANWVPCEPFPSAETPEKIRALLAKAAEANVNMLRVWGGGIFEQDAFYEECDRLGIMVTQDFLMACGNYPEEDDIFIDHLKDEARTAALSLRNHPCLVWWSGDNENAVAGDENMAAYKGRRAALEGIGPVLRALDPERPFLPSSPYGGVPYASGTRGTSHNTQFLGNFFAWVRDGDFTGYREVFDTYLDRFCAEQPAIGMPFASTLTRFMTQEEIYGDDTSVSEFHTKNNPGLGDVTLFSYVDRMARGIFGEYTDGHDRLKKQQMLQCEWVRLSMELYRRNLWYASGLIYWMWNDCWPAANGWSLVDYYGRPKPAWYAFRRAAKPLMASITEKNGTVSCVVSNTALKEAKVSLRLYRYGIRSGEEETLWEDTFTAAAEGVTVPVALPLAEARLNEETLLLADILCEDGASDRAFFLPLRWADMAFEAEAIEELQRTEASVTLKAEVTVPVLLYDGETLPRENGMFLKKGEQVTLTF